MPLDHIDPQEIQDIEHARQAIVRLLNLLADSQATVRELEAENQCLRGECSVDREIVLVISSAQLPADAEFRGYEDTLLQDVVLCTGNVLYHREKYYSPGEGRTYLAELPPGGAGRTD